jgi:hypothetical protein
MIQLDQNKYQMQNNKQVLMHQHSFVYLESVVFMATQYHHKTEMLNF